MVLIVDDFGIEYVGAEHANHLLSALRDNYTITTDWTGSKFAGIDIKWDYTKRTVRTTMYGYINNVRTRFGHPDPVKPEHSPHQHREIIYGAKEQFTSNKIDTSPPLDAAGIKWCQGVIGSLLYYARAVDNKLQKTLSTIAASQAAATENTRAEINKLLNYCATYPNDGITLEQAIWYWPHTRMQASIASPNHAAVLADTYSFPKMIQSHATMGQYNQSHVS